MRLMLLPAMPIATRPTSSVMPSIGSSKNVVRTQNWRRGGDDDGPREQEWFNLIAELHIKLQNDDCSISN
jgi:hypothetical protein